MQQSTPAFLWAFKAMYHRCRRLLNARSTALQILAAACIFLASKVEEVGTAASAGSPQLSASQN